MILSRRTPAGPGIRLDDGVYEGFTVPTEYDPLLGKLIAWGRDRAEAIARLERALEEYAVTGIKTNASLFRNILRDPEFIRGEIFTRWLDERLPDFSAPRRKRSVAIPPLKTQRFLQRCFIISARTAQWPRIHLRQNRNRDGNAKARLEQVDRNQ